MGKDKPTLAPRYKIYGAFALGLTTAVAFRALIVLGHTYPDWVRPVWYFAVLGNFLFFFYRFQITEKRKRTIRSCQLIEKVRSETQLSTSDREALTYLLLSIKRSPEHINYLIIFLFSLLAIGLDIALIFLH